MFYQILYLNDKTRQGISIMCSLASLVYRYKNTKLIRMNNYIIPHVIVFYQI
jgi:hypothetical protein